MYIIMTGRSEQWHYIKIGLRHLRIDNEDWITKFPSENTQGYFGTRRFDRGSEGENGKVHMISAAAILETSHRIPNLDYDILMKLIVMCSC